MGISLKAEKKSIWEPEDIRTFVNTADAMGYYSMGTAVLLNEWMGQRAGDIITMTMGAYRDGNIYITQSKTGAQVALPIDIVATLKARIESQIKENKARTISGTHLIQQHTGQPFKSDWFSHLFGKIRKKALEDMDEKRTQHFKKLIFQSLRHTAVTRLAEAGCEIPEIASITGHSFTACQDIVDRYNVRTKKMARNAFIKRSSQEKQ